MTDDNKINFKPVGSANKPDMEVVDINHSFGDDYDVDVDTSVDAFVAPETPPTLNDTTPSDTFLPEDIEDPWEKTLRSVALGKEVQQEPIDLPKTKVEEPTLSMDEEIDQLVDVAVDEAMEVLTEEMVDVEKISLEALTEAVAESLGEEVVEEVIEEVVASKAIFDLTDSVSKDKADEEITDVFERDGVSVVLPSLVFERQLRILNDEYVKLVPEDIIEDIELLVDAALEDPSRERAPLVQQVIDLRTRMETMIDLHDKTGVSTKFYKNLDGVYHMGFKDPATGIVKGFRPLSLGSKKGAVSSEEALLKAASFFKTGEPINVPLPHSGFWIYITPLSESDMVILYNTFADVKSRIGKLTFGLTYSNQSVKAIEVLFDFCKRFIFASSIDGVEKDDYLSLIKTNDIFTIAWALVRSSYATGFPFERICSNPACGHDETVNLDITEMFHFDNSRLTPFQKEHFNLSDPRKMKLDDVLRYQAETDFNKPFVFDFNGASIHLKQPTIEEFVSDGNAWIADVERKVDEELSKAILDPDEAEFKEELLLDQFLRSSFVRNWYHYVDRIEFGGNIAESRNAIFTVIGIMGTRRKFYDAFAKAIAEYRNSSVISTIGIREYLCPKCGVNQGDETGYIPLDVLNLFFTMSHIKYLVVTGDQMR